MKRSRLKASKRSRNRRKEVLRRDAECRAAVFERDCETCQRCGSGVRLQWSHVFSRRYYILRWDLQNSKVLCAGCHMWWTHNPMSAARWFEEKWPERWAYLHERMQSGERVRL